VSGRLSCFGHAGQIAMIIAAIGSNVEDGGDKSSESGFSGFQDCRDF